MLAETWLSSRGWVTRAGTYAARRAVIGTGRWWEGASGAWRTVALAGQGLLPSGVRVKSCRSCGIACGLGPPCSHAEGNA